MKDLRGVKGIKRGVQGLQDFAFCVLTTNNEHTKPRFIRKCRA